MCVWYTAPVIAMSPAKAPPRLPSTHTSLETSNEGKHTSLILIVGIGSGILIIVIVSVLVICSCTSRQGKTKASPKELGMWWEWKLLLH